MRLSLHLKRQLTCFSLAFRVPDVSWKSKTRNIQRQVPPHSFSSPARPPRRVSRAAPLSGERPLSGFASFPPLLDCSAAINSHAAKNHGASIPRLLPSPPSARLRRGHLVTRRLQCSVPASALRARGGPNSTGQGPRPVQVKAATRARFLHGVACRLPPPVMLLAALFGR